ncbi:MAG: cell division protein [Epsilonproteobacteria bacterium]|nr:MAG: cell division protein [Campylobacterota bacterium]
MIDRPLFAGVMMLLTLSLVMSYSLSTYAVVHFHYEDFHFFIRQGMAILLGFFAMLILSKMDPDIWFVRVGLFLFVVFFSLLIVMQFLPSSLVSEIGGAKRWIRLGSLSTSPVEFFKVGFIFFLSWSFARKFINKKKMGFWEELKAFSPYILVFLVAVILIAVFQKDLGQVIVLGGTLMVLFVFIGSSLKFFLLLLSGIFASFVGLIFFAPHRMARLKSWWGGIQDNILSILPFDSLQRLRLDTAGEPYQISNSLNAIYHGGFFGTGLGNGQFKLGYLSEVHTDFILAGISEELGFLGLCLVTMTILFIIFRIFKIASRVKNVTYYLFSIAVGLLISFSFILNAYGISGITPIKGIAVPFLSYGGSHILASCIAIGMVLMVSKQVNRDDKGRIK